LGDDTPDAVSLFNRTSTAASVLEQYLQRNLIFDTAATRQVGARVRDQTHSWFMRSRFHARAYVKPRGYAGDYYTIELLYAGVPRGEGLVGRALDAWVLERPAARAVRNRRVYITQALGDLIGQRPQGQPVRVCSLGSGPARELVDVLREPAGASVDATCIDMDADALMYAQGLARQAGVANTMSFVQANVVHLARAGTALPAKQHVIYSIGLFDYLSDRLAVAVLNWAYEQLHRGGRLLIGNVNTTNPTRAYMDHLLDWRLIHRSADDLRQLFARSCFGTQAVCVTRDATGVQLFAASAR
jgi:hypothetical protein